MNIVSLTKPSLTGHPSRLSVLDGLRKRGDVSVVEIGLGDALPKDCDALLVFGGDGTMLEAAVKTAGKSIPVVGVNLGNLGFLSLFEASATADDIIDALKKSKVSERMLLKSVVNGEILLALNDFVLKSSDTRPVTFDLRVGGHFADSYRSDGVIVATPTGSTAYSLSAGGPVMAPDLNAIIVNPVCPHSLHSRPLVVGGDEKVTLDVASGNAVLVVDGRRVTELSEGSSLTVEKAAEFVTLVTAENNDFYEKLLNKMNRWGTTP